MMRIISLLPRKMGQRVMETNSRRIAMVVTNIRGSDSELRILGAGMEWMLGFVPPPPGMALGFAVYSQYGQVMLSVNMDENIHGKNGAKLLMKSITKVFHKYGAGTGSSGGAVEN